MTPAEREQLLRVPVGTKALTNGVNGGKIIGGYKLTADKEFTIKDVTYAVKENSAVVTKAYNFAKNDLNAGIADFSDYHSGNERQGLRGSCSRRVMTIRII